MGVKGSNQLQFQEKLQKKGDWDLEGEANILWKEISGCIKEVTTEVLSVSKGQDLDHMNISGEN